MASRTSLHAALARTALAAWAVVLGSLTARTAGPEGEGQLDLEGDFTAAVRPFFEQYCVSCHGGNEPEADLNIAGYTTIGAAIADNEKLALVLEKLSAGEMPPEEAKAHPTAPERAHLVSWIEGVLEREAETHAGDPGIVLARRLSNAEYNNTIRDLTGVDIRPTREFPVDPANPTGFDNSGESLAMSPTLLEKYLQAAREVADFLVLKPDGLAFAPYPMLVETDRDKYCVEQIMSFYGRQALDYADYFEAAWQYKHRAELGLPDATLADAAAQRRVSAKYLSTVWDLLEDAAPQAGPIAKLQSMWQKLPTPSSDDGSVARAGCEQMRDFVVELRKKLEPRFRNLEGRGVDASSQPMLMWRNRLYASHRQLVRTAGPANRGRTTRRSSGRRQSERRTRAGRRG